MFKIIIGAQQLKHAEPSMIILVQVLFLNISIALSTNTRLARLVPNSISGALIRTNASMTVIMMATDLLLQILHALTEPMCQLIVLYQLALLLPIGI